MSGPSGPDGGKKPDPGVAGYGKAYEIIAASIQLAAAVILMVLLGQWLDGKFGTAPWLLLAGLATGFAAGLYSFLRSIQKMSGDAQSQDKKG